MSRKKALEQFHKDSISAAADKLFAQRGIEKTTMDEIAREAQYSKATLYVYFKSKDEIFYYIAFKSMFRLHEKFKTILSGTEEVSDAYFAICDVLAQFCEDNPLHFSIMLETIASDEESRKNTPILEDIYQIGETLNNDVDVIIQRGIEQGVLQEQIELPSPAMGLIQWAALSGIVSLANKKQDYIMQRTGMSRSQFLQAGFQMMYKSIFWEKQP